MYRLLVEEHWAAAAAEELRRYEEENRGFRRARALPPAAPLAREGTCLVVLTIALVTFAQWNQAFGLDWLAAGRGQASAVRAGELARVVTALTLHVDVPHLLSNLVFGALFAYLWLHSIGGGVGALTLLLAGALGNLVNACVHAGEHLSIGASTGVFAAVGLLGGSEARARHLLREPEARRFAPVGAAVLLMLYLGVGEMHTTRNVDVLAHVFGLLAGLGLGGVFGALPRATLERQGLQLACALAAGGLLATCWVVALR